MLIGAKNEAAIYQCEVIALQGTRQVNTHSDLGALFYSI